MKYECVTGSKFEINNLQECEDRFPSCDIAIGRLDECARDLYVDPCGTTPVGKACMNVRDCMWGASFSKEP